MEVTAKARNIRQSARKVRLVADMIRHMRVMDAFDQLKVSQKAARFPIEKVLRSVVANAIHNANLSVDTLTIKKITVDQGSMIKRWRARAFGRAAPIKKHLCHITVVVEEKAPDVHKNKEKKHRKEKAKVVSPSPQRERVSDAQEE